MKVNRILQVFIIGMVYCLVACSTPAEKKISGSLPEGALGGTVVSATQASSYVIMELEYDGETLWAAATYRELKPGDVVQLVGAMMMNDFTVKSLNRTFGEIYFASGLVVNGETEASAEDPDTGSSSAMQLPDGHPDIAAMQQTQGSVPRETGKMASAAEVQPLQDGVSIQELLANPGKYAGQTVRVRGVVAKFLDGIMKRNWVHLQDNTCGESHLTVTTTETAGTGDVLVIEGVVRTDVDFGHGYQYAVLVEDAHLQPEAEKP